MRDYHDYEYGRVKDTDKELFEKLCLEIFQAGLSWRTVLHKREAFRQCFFDFDIGKVADISPKYVETLMNDKRIIRNRRKIEAVVNNANMHLEAFGKNGSFKTYVYTVGSADVLMRGLKSRGYRFVGNIICESFLMSVGAIPAHEKNCFLYEGDKHASIFDTQSSD